MNLVLSYVNVIVVFVSTVRASAILRIPANVSLIEKFRCRLRGRQVRVILSSDYNALKCVLCAIYKGSLFRFTTKWSNEIMRTLQQSSIIEAAQLLMLFKQYHRVYSLSVSTWHNCSNSAGICLNITPIRVVLFDAFDRNIADEESLIYDRKCSIPFVSTGMAKFFERF